VNGHTSDSGPQGHSYLCHGRRRAAAA